MQSDASSTNAQFNRKSIISSQSTGSSNNDVRLNRIFISYSNRVLKNNIIYLQTNPALSKNYQASQSSSKPSQQLPGNYRSSMSSHSDIFMKVDEQKINFG